MPPPFTEGDGLPPDLGAKLAALGISMHVAGVVLIWWDYLLTLDKEVNRIWSRRKGTFLAYWILIRYMPPLLKSVALLADFKTNWSLSSCRVYSVYNALVPNLILLIAHFSFILRVYALYGRSIFATVLPTACWLAQLSLAMVIAHDGATVPNPVTNTGACFALLDRRYLTINIIVAVAFDSVVMALILTRCWWLYQKSGDSKLLSGLVRDGLGYFGVVFTVGVLNAVGLSKFGLTLTQLMLMFATTLPPIMVTRMILRLRRSQYTSSDASRQSSSNPNSTYQDLSVPQNVLTSVVDELFDQRTNWRLRTWRGFAVSLAED